MPAAKETYQSTLTQGTLSPRDSHANMVLHVTGLDGARESLDTAITTAIAGRLVHPDDSTLPLRSATGRWVRGADNGDNAEALVFLNYDKRRSGEATDATEFSNIANVDVRYERIQWWAPTLDTAMPYTIVEQPDPRAGNPAITMPRPNYITVPIMDVGVPAVLSSSPISTIEPTVGKTNSAPVTITGKSFAANTILNNGLKQRTTKVNDGVSVTYEFEVYYSLSIRRDGWRRSILTDDAGTLKTNVEDMYARAAFPTFPV